MIILLSNCDMNSHGCYLLQGPVEANHFYLQRFMVSGLSVTSVITEGPFVYNCFGTYMAICEE